LDHGDGVKPFGQSSDYNKVVLLSFQVTYANMLNVTISSFAQDYEAQHMK